MREELDHLPGLGGPRIECQGAGRFLACPANLPGIQEAVFDTCQEARSGQARERPGEARVAAQRLLKVLHGPAVSLGCAQPELVPAPQVGLPCRRIAARPACRHQGNLLLLRKPRHFRCHRHRHLALKRENVGHFAVEPEGPDVRVAGGVDELEGDAHLVASERHRPLHQRIDAEFAPDHRRGAGRALVLHRRGPRRDAQPFELAEARGQFLLQTRHEVGLAGVRGEVLQGKHGDRGDRLVGIVGLQHDRFPPVPGRERAPRRKPARQPAGNPYGEHEERDARQHALGRAVGSPPDPLPGQLIDPGQRDPGREAEHDHDDQDAKSQLAHAEGREDDLPQLEEYEGDRAIPDGEAHDVPAPQLGDQVGEGESAFR